MLKYIFAIALVVSFLAGGSVVMAAKGGEKGKPTPPDDGGSVSHPPIAQPFLP